MIFTLWNLSLKDTANQTLLLAAPSEEKAGTHLQTGVEAWWGAGAPGRDQPRPWRAFAGLASGADNGQLNPESNSWTRRPDAGSTSTALGNSPWDSHSCLLIGAHLRTFQKADPQEPLSWVRGTLPSFSPYPQPPPTPFHPRSHSRQLQQMLSLLLPGPGNPSDQLWASLPQLQGALLLRAHICNFLQGFLLSYWTALLQTRRVESTSEFLSEPSHHTSWSPTHTHTHTHRAVLRRWLI